MRNDRNVLPSRPTLLRWIRQAKSELEAVMEEYRQHRGEYIEAKRAGGDIYDRGTCERAFDAALRGREHIEGANVKLEQLCARLERSEHS